MHTESAAPTASAPATTGRETLRAAVVVGALGVVFGDIGTSPIYTIQTVFNPADPHPVPISSGNVFGVVSLDLLVRDDHRDADLRHAGDARRATRARAASWR